MWGDVENVEFETVEESEVRRFLRAARPAWTPRDLEKVETKLTKVNIRSLDEFRIALNVPDRLNELLQSHGEKGFAASTLESLQEQLSKPLPGALKVLVRRQLEVPTPPLQVVSKAAIIDEPAVEAQNDMPLEKPIRSAPKTSFIFKVVQEMVPVFAEPSEHSHWLGRKLLGQQVVGEEETFNGWMKLSNADGWILRCVPKRNGLETLLAPLEDLPPLPTHEVSEAPGGRHFEVVCQSHVYVRSSPSLQAPHHSIRKFGDRVNAVSQRYDGWIRLADDLGWMQSFSQEHGPLLLCPYNEHLASWKDTKNIAKTTLHSSNEAFLVASVRDRMKQSLVGHDFQSLKGAIMAAKLYSMLAPMSRDEVRAAELMAEKLRWGYSDANRNYDSTDPVAEAGRKLLAEETENEQNQRLALEYIESASSTGDAEALRLAITRAKSVGVSKRELARAHAMSSARLAV